MALRKMWNLGLPEGHYQLKRLEVSGGRVRLFFSALVLRLLTTLLSMFQEAMRVP